MSPKFFAIIPMVTFSGIALALVVSPIRSGRIQTRQRGFVERAKSPVKFWCTIVFFATTAIGYLVTAVIVWREG